MDQEVRKLVFVSNWPVLDQMPESVARKISEDTEQLGMLYAVYDPREFSEWCADSTTVDEVWPNPNMCALQDVRKP